MVFHGAGAQEELGSRVAVACPFGDQTRDLKLLRCQLPDSLGIAVAYHLASGPELVPCTLLPQRRADAREGLEGWSQLHPGFGPTPGAAQELAEQELRSRAVKRGARGLMEQERFRKWRSASASVETSARQRSTSGSAHDAPVSAVHR